MPGYINDTGGQYAIPYPNIPAPISQLGEARAALISANALNGIRRALKNGGFCVFAEGTYAGTFTSDNSSVALSAGSGPSSLDALVAGVWVKTASAMTWAGLANSTTNYLYAQLIESNIYASNQISSRQGLSWNPISNTSGVTPSNALLLAVATTTGSAITVLSSAATADSTVFSDGKPYALAATSGRDFVTLGGFTKVVSYLGMTTNGRVLAVKTSAGPAIDYIEKGVDQFTVHLVGAAAPANVTFDWFIDHI